MKGDAWVVGVGGCGRWDIESEGSRMEDREGRNRPAPPLWEENLRLAQQYIDMESSLRAKIRELTRLNEQLRSGETHFKRLIELSSEGFLLLDSNACIINANKALCRMLGMDFEDVIGQDFRQFVEPESLAALSALLAGSHLSGGASDVVVIVSSDLRDLTCRFTGTAYIGDEHVESGVFFMVTDIAREIAARRQLQEARRYSEAAVGARETFLSIVGNELKTPLQSIVGMAQMVLDTDLDARQVEFARIIYSSASRLMRLVSDIVDLTRLGAEDIKIDPAPCSPRALIRSEETLFRHRAENKGLTLSVSVSDAVPRMVTADGLRIRQVLTNMLDNAFKFTERGGVTVSLDVLDGNLRFMVSDTGPGIAPDFISKVFHDFSRSEQNIQAGRLGGLGLGLTISKKIVSLMGGKIGVDSDLGHGSVFYFTIPCVPTDACELADEGAAASADLPRLPSLRILLAEDDPDSRQMILAILGRDSHHVITAANGLHTVEAFRLDAFDIILMDTRMPTMDGLEATIIIRDSENDNTRIPIIALEADESDERWDACRRAGMDAIVRKPVRPGELISAMASVVGVRGVDAETPKAYDAMSSGAELRRIDAGQFFSLHQTLQAEHFDGILRIFLDDAMPGVLLLPEMASTHTPDRERMIFLTNKAKGAAGYLGLRSLSDLLARIEGAARSGKDVAVLQRLTEEIPSCVEDTLAELHRVLPNLFLTLDTVSVEKDLVSHTPDNTGKLLKDFSERLGNGDDVGADNILNRMLAMELPLLWRKRLIRIEALLAEGDHYNAQAEAKSYLNEL